MIVDSWAVRGWLFYPWCALRRHKATFWMRQVFHFPDSPPEGDTIAVVSRCSCGRRTRKEAGWSRL